MMCSQRPLPMLGAALAAALCGLSADHAAAQIVRIDTQLGNIYFQMRPDAAPGTVTNFLNYVNDGDYIDSFIHRSVPGFIIQGGGFTFTEEFGVNSVPTDSPIGNEYNLSNVRGTVAMAKVGGDPDSATSQWFINLADNSENLDNQNGGFTVFAEVIQGMDVADAIAGLQILNAGGVFSSIPVLDSYVPNTIDPDEVVKTLPRVVLPGDTDGDGDIDDSDLGNALSNYTGPLASGTGTKTFEQGDFDFDGDVDDSDLGAALSNYTGPLSVSVPEPASALLLGLGGLALVRRRRG